MPLPCRTLTLGLLMELEGRTIGDQRRQEARQWISTLVWRKGEERLKARMEAYWRSEAFLSEEIGEVLAAGRRAEAADDSTRQPAVASYVINTGGGAAIMGGTFGGVEFNANKLGQLDYERK